jgi:hypothetical protein
LDEPCIEAAALSISPMSGRGLDAESASGLALEETTTSCGTVVPGSGSAALARAGTGI